MKRSGDGVLQPLLCRGLCALVLGLPLFVGAMVVCPPEVPAQVVPQGSGKDGSLQLAPLTLSEPLPFPGQVPQSLPVTAPQGVPGPSPANGKVLPISLDTVLRLAQDQNGKLALAREKVNGAFAEAELAARKWLPELTFGPSFHRHEGGIQDFTGALIHSSYGALFAGVGLQGRLDLREAAYQKIQAEREIWQKKGELSKLSSEMLLDAATTYVDFLTALASEAISRDVERHMRGLLKQAQTLANVDPGVRVEAVRVEAELAAQQQTTRKLREGASAAQAKLIYLLGLDPDAELLVLERQLTIFHLVDATRPLQGLVEQALGQGPGVRELEGLLALIDSQRCKAQGLQRLLPTFEANVAEGAFGAGPGAGLTWDNRFDLCLQARWNLTNLLTLKQQQNLLRTKTQQLHLGYQELRAKLTMGVCEAREAILSNLEQVHLGKKQIHYAQEVYDLSDYRLRNNIRGRTPSEVLMAIGSLARAQFRYLEALGDHDKAQTRLFVLLGAADESAFSCPPTN